jgi:hypothetical protein
MINSNRIVRVALGAALAFGLALPAFAAGNAGAHASVHGSVTAVSGSTITLAANNGATYSVVTGNRTSFFDVVRGGTFGTRSRSASSLSGIAVGDTLTAKGALSGATLSAKTVLDVTGARPIHGSVTAVSGSTITLTTKSGSVYTINTSNSTQFWQVAATGGPFGKRTKTPSSLDAIGVGDKISVHGTAGASNTAVVNATTVLEHLSRSNA